MTPTLKDDKLSSRIESTVSVDGVSPRKYRNRSTVQVKCESRSQVHQAHIV